MVKQELIQWFFSTQSFKWNPTEGFRLASGIITPFYVDCRALLANPTPRLLVAQLAAEHLHTLTIDVVGGLEIGAIPLSTAISDFGYQTDLQKEWRTFVVRKKPKDYGLGKLIEGASRSGDHALIVDDVLSTGASIITAIQAARESGLIVNYALVIVDRQEQNGKQNVEKEGVTLINLLTLDDLKAAQSMNQ